MELCGFTSAVEMLPRLRVARVEGGEVLLEADEGLTLRLERTAQEALGLNVAPDEARRDPEGPEGGRGRCLG